MLFFLQYTFSRTSFALHNMILDGWHRQFRHVYFSIWLVNGFQVCSHLL